MFVTLFGRGVGCCLATGLPLGCEAVFERRVRYSIIETNPPRWRFPRWEYSGLEILHGGVGGDVERGVRTSEHILVFAFDPLVSLTLTLLFVQSIIHIIHIYLLVLPCIFHIVVYRLYAWLACVCASLVLNHKSFI